MARPKLGEVLVKLGLLDAQQLQAALGHQKQWGQPLGKTVVQQRLCTAEQVLSALSKQTGLPPVDLDREPLGAHLAALLPRKAAEQHKAVPLRAEGKRSEVLVVAIAAPATLEQLDALTSAAGRQRVTAFLGWDDAIERAIGRIYRGESFVAPVASAPPQTYAPPIDAREQELDLGEPEAAAPAAADALGGLKLSEACLRVIHTAASQHQVSPGSVVERVLESWAAKQKLS
ncbi:MAG: GspE/PulE/PilB domain-containing protein [Myxococcaceae bacterium]